MRIQIALQVRTHLQARTYRFVRSDSYLRVYSTHASLRVQTRAYRFLCVCVCANLFHECERRSACFGEWGPRLNSCGAPLIIFQWRVRVRHKSYVMKVPKQCRGTCSTGRRCQITSSSTLKDKCGHCVASPLEASDYCLFHLELFRPARFLDDNVRVFWLDFETSGLDVVANSIVEIGVLENDGAAFQTVVCPPVFVEGPAVHGISNEELAEGPCFAEAYERMRRFIENLLDMAVDRGGHRLIDRPVALIAAHNGQKFDFRFLASELAKRNIDVTGLTSWFYCDTLDITRLCSVECCKLQCLFTSCASSTRSLHAHRALDDCTRLNTRASARQT